MRILKTHIEECGDSFYEKALRYLSYEHKLKASKYRNREDQCSCIVGDYMLHKCVSEECNCSLADVRISHSDTGQPYITYPNNTGLYISLSHSGGYVIAAINPFQIGIDIEIVRDIDEAVLNHVLSDVEKEYVGRSKRRFFEVWTMKEAYLKCIGIGITGLDMLKKTDVFHLSSQYNASVFESTDEYVISICYLNSECPA